MIGATKAELYPAFSLSGTFGFLSTDIGNSELSDAFDWKSRVASFGPAVVWNFFNYGQITNQVRAQDAAFQQAILSYQNTVLQAQQEVEDGLASFLGSQDTVALLSEAVAAAQRSVDLAAAQYRAGATSYTTVLTAQQTLLAQQDQLAVTQGSVAQGLISLYRALGGGWETRARSGVRPAPTSRRPWPSGPTGAGSCRSRAGREERRGIAGAGAGVLAADAARAVSAHRWSPPAPAPRRPRARRRCSCCCSRAAARTIPTCRRRRPQVTVSRPVQRTVTDTIELTGNTQSSNTVNLVARVAGYLQSVNFKDGSFVKKGDLLFVIEPEPYEANVQLAEATVEQQQATLTQATSEYERQQRLIKQKATSESEVESWQAQRNGGAGRRRRGERQPRDRPHQPRLHPDRGAVRRPGRRRQVDPGNLVGARRDRPSSRRSISSRRSTSTSTSTSRRCCACAPACARPARRWPDVEPVKLGIGLQNETGYPHEATLDFVATDVDQSTGTLQARGVIANKDYVFLPGLFVRVQIPVGTTDNALLVPDRAVGIDQRGHYLLVVGKDDVVAQRPVQIGALARRHAGDRAGPERR